MDVAVTTVGGVEGGSGADGCGAAMIGVGIACWTCATVAIGCIAGAPCK
jgi:hypothetical protein